MNSCFYFGLHKTRFNRDKEDLEVSNPHQRVCVKLGFLQIDLASNDSDLERCEIDFIVLCIFGFKGRRTL